ncbi:hypothetical protein EV360DRAFT_85549 [Lentinula raphanica]|nr:hypothetical protein EV360DRAFT_85549 [Lentinula raphanica]
MVSDWAVWSGYQLEADAYKCFVGVFEGTGDAQAPDKRIIDYVCDYVQWRELLPPKLAARAPNIRFRTSDREGTNITHIFFPIRFIPFKTRRQLNDPTHPDYVIAHEETEKDKRKLQSLLNYIHAHNGGEHRMNADLFEFAVMKDLHPLAEWRAVIPVSSSFPTTSTMLSNWAVWSGYQLEPHAFIRFIGVLEGTGAPPDPDRGIVSYILDYVHWRNHLPPKDAAKAPRIRFRASDPEEENITHIFFPIRFIPFKSRRQLDDPTHPDYPTAHEETEKDKGKVERLLNYIHATNGGEHRISADVFEFAVMKDLHPRVEWRVVRL